MYTFSGQNQSVTFEALCTEMILLVVCWQQSAIADCKLRMATVMQPHICLLYHSANQMLKMGHFETQTLVRLAFETS